MLRGSVAIALSLLLLAACKRPSPGVSCAHETEAVCKDKSAILTCKGGKWEEAVCRGAEGCVRQGAVVRCDESAAMEGDPCGTIEGDHYTCSPDRKTELKCEAGKWKLVGKCGGPGQCEAKYPFVKCDNTIAAVGDLCAKDGDAACSVDAKSILECKAGKFAQTEKCAGKCKVDALLVKCQ